jgi:hypothetical protein
VLHGSIRDAPRDRDGLRVVGNRDPDRELRVEENPERAERLCVLTRSYGSLRRERAAVSNADLERAPSRSYVLPS